ncbi:MAG: SDR family oxidoreductase [Saprospiraceae bacterium]|nr:SDR family oxidoreductase [Saprospiraceae bacterium]
MLQDKNIAILGASSGIGLALTRLLHAQGAQLWVYSRRPMPEDLPDVRWAPTDVLSPDFQLPGLPERLDGFVYAPGSINLKPFNRIKPDDFRQELEINAVGAFRALQLAFPTLKAAQGSVVLFSTVAAQTGMPFHAGIAAAKGAIEGMTRALAAEWAPTVRINAVAPSLTDTPLASALLSTEEKRQNAAARHPLKRVGAAADIAQAALFLLDAETSGFITGQVLHVDGGMGNLK